MATVKIPPVLRPSVGGEKEVQAAGEDVGAVLNSLAEQHPGTQSQLFSGDGQLNRYVNVYLNDEDVRVLDGLQTNVSESDTLVILPAMAGGAVYKISFGALAASTERSPPRSRSAAPFSAATATQVSAPPTLTRCAPASNSSPVDAKPRWPSTLTGLPTAPQTERTSSRLRSPGAKSTSAPAAS